MVNPERTPVGPSRLDQVLIEKVPVNEDSRRSLWEFHNDEKLRLSNGRFIVVKGPAPGEKQILANHYHTDNELFFLAQGEIEAFVLEDIETKERRTLTNIGAGTKIIIPAGIAHLIIFTKPAVLLTFNESPTPDNTFPYEFKF